MNRSKFWSIPQTKLLCDCAWNNDA